MGAESEASFGSELLPRRPPLSTARLRPVLLGVELHECGMWPYQSEAGQTFFSP